MTDIDLNRVEKRYTAQHLDQLLEALKHLSFEKKVFSDNAITLTYF